MDDMVKLFFFLTVSMRKFFEMYWVQSVAFSAKATFFFLFIHLDLFVDLN
jgi:hypothetical protein